ncbi:CHAT domain-containing protein [Kribbella sp. NPDC026611]|uniref:CHAT domain-containing protein n=1 Tax=Kribbella sp. NPDC026611 TaxID=3154911 RepID=UPI0033DE9506
MGVIWRLTLEPVGADVAWSLLHRDGSAPTKAVIGGIVRDTRAEADATFALVPRPSADGRVDPTANVLTDPARELATAELLGARLLPPALRERLNGDGGHTVQIAARGWLANVPWDAITVNAGTDTRLIEKAILVSAMSPGIAATRARSAPPSHPGSPGLAIIDAGPAEDTMTGESAIYPGRLPAELVGPGGIDPGDVVAPGKYSMSAAEAAKALTEQEWSRLFYLGHVAGGRPEEPAAAALVFQRHGIRDLLTAGMWLAEPGRWPAPARVALIGGGSDDARFTEASGLPVAAINAGAGLVTCTRWALPTDRPQDAYLPATRLALAVYRAHRAERPIESLRAWQLDQLATWKEQATPESSPVYWAALTSYVAPEVARG